MPKPPNRVKLGPECSDWTTRFRDEEERKKIEVMFKTLKEREDAGDHIRRRQWPKHQAYEGITSLFRYKIDKQMRASYTLVDDGRNLIVEIIEIFSDHKSYAKRFGYRD